MNNHSEQEDTVDVVIPVFNGERYLEEAVISAVKQSYRPNKIFICNDASTDATGQIAENLSRAHDVVHHLQLKHGGEAWARNNGIRNSDAKYIAFLDADDLWKSDKLEKQINKFRESGEKTSAIHCGYSLIDENGSEIKNRTIIKPRHSGNIFEKLLFEGYAVSGSSSAVILRREILSKSGLFDEKLHYGTDLDLWIRIAKISDFDFVNEDLSIIRVHSESIQNRKSTDREARFFQQLLMIYAKWDDEVGQNKKFRNELRRKAIDSSLPLWRNPSMLFGFYRSIKENDSKIAQSLFTGPTDYYFQVILALSQIFLRKFGRTFRFNAK